MQIQTEDWGMVDYMQAYQRQRQAVDAVIAGGPERLIFCEHPPVLTLGRMTRPESFLFDKEDIQRQGIQVEAIDRGGDVTLHAPGQLVVYAVMDLNVRGKDLKRYLKQLEYVAVALLKDFGILAISVPGKRGVFVDADKIISIGIGVRKWVTYHGLGINVSTDLSLFRFIRPCGLDVRMTTMNKALGKAVDMQDVRTAFTKRFLEAFRS